MIPHVLKASSFHQCFRASLSHTRPCSSYSSKLCRFCGSHDSDSTTRSYNHQLPYGKPALHEDLDISWLAGDNMEKK